MNHKQINFSYLNCKNFKSNFIYSEYLTFTSSVIYLNELWLKQNECTLIDSICKKKSYLFKSDMDFNYRKGRPFGGQAFLIDESIKVLESDFLNRHLCYTLLDISGTNFLIVGVYMPFDDLKQDSKSIYEITLSYLSAILSKYENSDIPIFILGDFNADLRRNNRFDIILENYITDHKLVPLDHQFTQMNNYTFSADLGIDKSYFANLDHVLVLDRPIYAILENFQCNILDDPRNTSDHRALSIEFSFDHNLIPNTSIPPKIQPNFIKFEDALILEYYKINVEKHLDTLLHKYFKSNDQIHYDKQKYINDLYNDLTESIVSAVKNTLAYQNVNFPQYNSSCHKKTNNKSWFTPELAEIKNNITELKYRPSNPVESIAEIKILKTKFRRIQRQNIYLSVAKEHNTLDRLAREKDKNKFWKFIKNKRKKRAVEKDVSIPQDALFNHYSTFFTDNINNLTEEQIDISAKVKEFLNNYSTPQNEEDLPFFKFEILEEILKELEDSNVKGHDGLTYSYLKKCASNKLTCILWNFFNLFIKYNVIPDNFNISIIKPIIKDQNKNSDDINNIRPLSISNCLSQIFEKLILKSSPELNKIHKNQFGFKPKTSCNHAIFVMKETVLNYIEKGSNCRMASLDAEKAFDKVWRDGLFFKLYPKLNTAYWVLLKKYYDLSQGTILLPNINYLKLTAE